MCLSGQRESLAPNCAPVLCNQDQVNRSEKDRRGNHIGLGGNSPRRRGVHEAREGHRGPSVEIGDDEVIETQRKGQQRCRNNSWNEEGT